MFLQRATNAFGSSFDDLIIHCLPITSSQISPLPREYVHIFLTFLYPNASSITNSPWEPFAGSPSTWTPLLLPMSFLSSHLLSCSIAGF